MQIISEQKQILSRIASRLLNLRAGTPVTQLRRSLGPKRKILDDLLVAKLLRTVDDIYLPTFRGIERLDDDIREAVRMSLTFVLRGIRGLLASDDRSTFGFNVIVEETRRQNPTLDDNDVLPALILGVDLGFYYFPHNFRRDEQQVSVDGVTWGEQHLSC